MMKYLLVTDLDDTLVGNDQATDTLNQFLLTHRQQFLIVYATGRSYLSTYDLIKTKSLLEPDYIIASVGTLIYHQTTLDQIWTSYLNQDWDRKKIFDLTKSYLSLKLQPLIDQNPWKISFYLTGNHSQITLSQLQSEISQKGLKAQLVYSSDRDLDILPEKANKGNALNHLLQKINISPEDTLVCGDSGNDISLFQQNTKGVIVANAKPELLKWYQENPNPNVHLATTNYAEGILEGIHFLGNNFI